MLLKLELAASETETLELKKNNNLKWKCKLQIVKATTNVYLCI